MRERGNDEIRIPKSERNPNDEFEKPLEGLLRLRISGLEFRIWLFIRNLQYAGGVQILKEAAGLLRIKMRITSFDAQKKAVN